MCICRLRGVIEISEAVADTHTQSDKMCPRLHVLDYMCHRRVQLSVLLSHS